MANEVELFLGKDGFYAGHKTKSGKMAAGSHKLTEEEIITMYATLLRVYKNKTKQDVMVVQGADGMAMIAKLVPLKDAEPQKKAVKVAMKKKK